MGLEDARVAARLLLEVRKALGPLPDTWSKEALLVCAEFLRYENAALLTDNDKATERELVRQWRAMTHSNRARDISQVAAAREVLWMARRDLALHARQFSFTTSLIDHDQA